MLIDFEKEITSITSRIKLAEDYFSCEDAIITNIKTLIGIEEDIPAIETYLKQLHGYFSDLIKQNSGTPECINYIYASSFLKVLTESIYWHSWIKGIK